MRVNILKQVLTTHILRMNELDNLYAREDYETNINTNSSTPSKPH